MLESFLLSSAAFLAYSFGPLGVLQATTSVIDRIRRRLLLGLRVSLDRGGRLDRYEADSPLSFAALNRSLTLLLGAAFPSCGANGLLIILIDQSSIQPTFE